MIGWPFDPVLALLSLALVLLFVRLLLGPSLPDRVVALDTIAIVSIALLSVLAIATGRESYLDIALTLALIAFLATIALARYAELSAADRDDAG